MRARLAAVTFALLLLSAPAAHAHVEVRDGDPRPDGTTTAGTDEISIAFISLDADEPIEIRVLDPDGRDVVTGDVELEPRDSTATVAVEPLGEGTHTVEWTATSDDGDGVITDDYTFEVRPAAGGDYGVWLLWGVVLGVPAILVLRSKLRSRT